MLSYDFSAKISQFSLTPLIFLFFECFKYPIPYISCSHRLLLNRTKLRSNHLSRAAALRVKMSDRVFNSLLMIKTLKTCYIESPSH